MTDMNETNNTDFEKAILCLVHAADYTPIATKAIIAQLGLPGEHARPARITIKRLIREGRLTYGKKRAILPVGTDVDLAASTDEDAPSSAAGAAGSSATPGERKREAGLITGEFRRATKGYGFVRPATAPPAAGRQHDIFIPLRDTRDASTGDIVTVRLKRLRRGAAKASGSIVEIVQRETNQFVGAYLERGGQAFVQIDGHVVSDPLPVSDPGAKNAMAGDKVVVEMVRFPTHYQPGEAVIVEVLGARGAPGVDTLSIIREFNLPDRFSLEVMDTARAQAERFDESIGDRLDLTDQTIITIDPKDARDFDDAISLARLDNGHWRLGVHIADVAHFVPAGSPLDVEARARGTSVYLPGRVLPMLPELICNGLASLQPGKVRYAKTVFIEFTADGARVAAEFHNSAICGKRRFAYEEVDSFLSDPNRWKSKLTSGVFALLGRMRELALILRRRRLENGAIELTLPEVKIDLDKAGRVAGAHVVQHTVSHQIIEEFMLAANEAVAEHLDGLGLNFLRRIHEPPDPRKLFDLTEFVRELGVPCDSLQNRFEIKRVVEAVRGEPREHAVHYAVLRSLQKAVYSPRAEGHFALNSQHYCHFTSPIRRYPDLVVHRALDALARGVRPRDDFDYLANLGQHCSDREQRAEAAERELVKVKLLTFLSTRIGEQMDAVVTGVEEFGLFAQGIELPAEGMIRVAALSDDFYRYDRRAHCLTGYRRGQSYRLGDLVVVEIAHVDIGRRELGFRLVRRLESPSGQKILPTVRRQKKGAKGSGKKAAPKRKAGKRAAKRRRD